MPSYELQYQFLPENKFLKTECVTRFHHSPYDRKKLSFEVTIHEITSLDTGSHVKNLLIK